MSKVPFFHSSLVLWLRQPSNNAMPYLFKVDIKDMPSPRIRIRNLFINKYLKSRWNTINSYYNVKHKVFQYWWWIILTWYNIKRTIVRYCMFLLLITERRRLVNYYSLCFTTLLYFIFSLTILSLNFN